MLPFTFKNTVMCITFLLYGLCFLSLAVFIGIFYSSISISNYALYNKIYAKNQRKAHQTQMEMAALNQMQNSYFMPVRNFENVEEQWMPCNCEIYTCGHMFTQKRPRFEY